MVNINVLGCCVSRDTLAFKADKYNVLRYLAFTSPYSMYNGVSVDFSAEISNATGVSNFCKKMLNLDARKKNIEYLKEVSAEWLLFDVADSRQPIIKFENNVILTYNLFIRSIVHCIAQRAIFGEAKIIKAEELPKDELLNALNCLLNDIREIYKPGQIIFHEFYRYNDFISKHGYYKKFNLSCIAQNDIWNKLIRELNQFCITHLDGCHVIPALNNAIPDENHKWGLSPYHFCKEYYEYAENAITIITERYDRRIEEEKLAALHNLYTEKFEVIREHALHNLTRVDRERLRAFSRSFEAIIENNLLLHDENGISYLCKSFLAKGYQHIAIYGYTEITKVLCKILKDTEISIDYIVENAAKPVPGFKTVNRNPANYPDCDIMLVADIYNYSDIKAKLEKLKLAFPFVNAAEFIQSLPAGQGIGELKAYVNSLKEKQAALEVNVAQLQESAEKHAAEKAQMQAAFGELSDRYQATEQKAADLAVEVDGLQVKNKAAQRDIEELSAKNKAAHEEVESLQRKQIAAQKQIASITSQRDAAIADAVSLRNSVSYKFGRVMTFLPRKIRDIFKKK